MTVRILAVILNFLGGAGVVAALFWRSRVSRLGPKADAYGADVYGADAAGAYPIDPIDVAAALVTVALLAFTALGVISPVRIVIALAFVTLVPGWALLGVVDPLDRVRGAAGPAAGGRVASITGLTRTAMAVAISLALCTATAQALLWANLWHPSVILGLLGAFSLVLLSLSLAWRRPFSATLLDLR